MLFCPSGSQFHENPFTPQPLEITPFRLTPPFRLAYTDFIGPEGDFQPRPGNTNICMTFLARLVRDPICGMHVDETLSIPFRDEGELLHFCSLACRDAYAESTKKFAANG